MVPMMILQKIYTCACVYGDAVLCGGVNASDVACEGRGFSCTLHWNDEYFLLALHLAAVCH